MISKIFLAALALSSFTFADEATFRDLELDSRTLQLQDLNNSQGACTAENIAVRREWGSLSTEEKKAYISAVKCIRTKPSLTYPGVPGARSLYDDFQAVHINQTKSIHWTGVFLSWHRYFTWAYEQALRNECGYEGYQPYWEWSTFASDPTASPLFDGSETSVSGNGAKEVRSPVNWTLPNGINVTFPQQGGGGCLTDGPFANATVNLGPVNNTLSIPGWIGDGTGFDYNPRCLRRDMGNRYSTNLGWDSISGLLSNSTNFTDFQTNLQQVPHAGGHSTIGGLQNDFATSPGDPAFYFHHSQVDRIWTLWQNLDIEKRRLAIGGTLTWFNIPPSPNVTLDHPLDLGVLAPQVKLETLMSTIAGPFCYRYE